MPMNVFCFSPVGESMGWSTCWPRRPSCYLLPKKSCWTSKKQGWRVSPSHGCMQAPTSKGPQGARSLEGCAGGRLSSLQLTQLRSSLSLFGRRPRGLELSLNFCWDVPWVHLRSHCSEAPPASSGRQLTGGVNLGLRVPPLPSPPDWVSLPEGVLKAKRRQATCHLSER